MPTIGATKLRAINHMLLSLGMARVGALDTSGSSDAAEAEYVLDSVARKTLMRGVSSNTRRHVTIVSSNTGEIDLNASLASQSPATPAPLALRVSGSGKYQDRRFSLRGSKIYDEVKGSTVAFGTTESVTVDIVEELSATSPANFEDIDPVTKELILAEAVQEYRAMKRPDPQVDQLLERSRTKVENSVQFPPNLSADAAAVRFGGAGGGQGNRGQ